MMNSDLNRTYENTRRSWEMPESWPGTLAGAGLFLMAGMELILGEIPHEWNAPAWTEALRGVLFFGLLIIPAVGCGYGWVKGFQRWNYSYLGMGLLFSLYMVGVATPGLRIFGYTFDHDDLWGWRAFIPFLAALGIVLLIRRSFEPFIAFFRDSTQDWTVLTFFMFGWMPLFIAIGFDEMDRLLSLYCMIAFTILLVCTALAYLRSTRTWQQVASLFTGIFLCVGGTQLVGTLYWLENGWMSVLGVVLSGVLVAAIMLSPLLIPPLFRLLHSVDRLHS